MKLTKATLKKIIKEELENIMSEAREQTDEERAMISRIEKILQDLGMINVQTGYGDYSTTVDPAGNYGTRMEVGGEGGAHVLREGRVSGSFPIHPKVKAALSGGE